MAQDNIMVSVLSLAYNQESLIRSALDGFVMQKTDFAFEVLVNDDASPDGTAKIILEYAEKYPDIIIPVCQKQNLYSQDVDIIIDVLTPMARGKYLAFCEGDDFWTDPYKLQKQVDFLEKNSDYVACVHNSVAHDCSGQTPDCLLVENKEEHDLTFEDVIQGMYKAYQTSSLMLRRELHDHMPEFYHIACDYGFGDWPKAIWLTLNGKVRFMPEPMSTYRIMSNPSSWSANNFSVKRRLHGLEGDVAMLSAVKELVCEEKKALTDKVILEKKFTMCILEERFKELRKPPFDALWKQMSSREKLKIYIKEWFPWLYHRFRKIRD